MFLPYELMKEKTKKIFDERNHFEALFLVLRSMFDWEGLPDTVRPELLEGLLMTQGTACFAKIGDGIYTGTGGYCGDVKNFLPQEYQFVNVGIGEYRGFTGKTCEVCWNNSSIYPDLFLMQYASILTEIDVSERCNVLFSRLLRIPRVKDTKEKTAIEECVKSIMDGKFSAVVSDNIQHLLLDDAEHPENRFLDLADVTKVDKLQYLNQYRDNIIKRFFQMYGQGMQSTAKLAQQTTDELHGNDAVSMILPLDRLKQRQDFCERCNTMFGLKMSVKFSEAFNESLEEMQETYSDGTKEKPETEEKKGDEDYA